MPGRRTGSLLSRTVSGGATAAAATLKLIRTGSAKLRLVSFAHGGVTGSCDMIRRWACGPRSCAVGLLEVPHAAPALPLLTVLLSMQGRTR